jgi:hypothetical protein
MTDQGKAITQRQSGDWRPQVFMIGGLVGAVLGLLSAYLYVRAAEQSQADGSTPEGPAPTDAVKLGLSLLTIIRTITEWGSR